MRRSDDETRHIDIKIRVYLKMKCININANFNI